MVKLVKFMDIAHRGNFKMLLCIYIDTVFIVRRSSIP